MELMAWLGVMALIAAIFLVISGEVVVTLILTALWVGGIWLLVSYGGTVMDAAWPAILLVLALVVLSIATLAVLASTLEDRRMKKDRGRSAPPR